MRLLQCIHVSTVKWLYLWWEVTRHGWSKSPLILFSRIAMEIVNSGQSRLALNLILFVFIYIYRVQADIAAVIWYVLNQCAVSDIKCSLF